MRDTVSLKNEVTSIVNYLAKSIVTEIMTKQCTLKQGHEEELDALVDGLCVEAIDNILRIIELVTTIKQHDLPSIQLNKSSQTEEDLNRGQGEETSASEKSVPHQPAAKTIIVIYGSALPNAKKPLVSTENRDSGMNNWSLDADNIQEVKGGMNTPNVSVDEDPENGPDDEDSMSPPTPTDRQDHEYAQPSSPVSTDENTGSATQNRKRKGKKMPSKRRRKKTLKAPEPMNHPCTQCTGVFPSAERLSEHQRKAHRECKACGEFFPGVIKLREHEIKVHGVLPFKCEYCDKSFIHRGHCDTHMKSRHTGEKTCHCDVCGKGYCSVTALKTHKLTHSNKTFTCDVCGKSFYQAGHLVRHKLVHEEVRPYQCEFCGRGFTQAENMMKHRVVHTDDAKQLCSLCGKSYTTRDGLRNHMISKHSHELPPEELPVEKSIITCDVCGKKFLHPSQLKLHIKTHTGDKPFHCDVCGKCYRLKQMLIDHKYTHTGERPYKCTVCDKTFHSCLGFTRHKNTHSGELPYRCTLCDKSFNRITSFSRHKSIHSGEMPYSCNECGKHFRLLTFLKAHEQTLGHRQRVTSGLKGENDGSTQETDL